MTDQTPEQVMDLLSEHVNDNFYGECVACSSKARIAAGSVWPGPSVRWPCDVVKDIALRAAGLLLGPDKVAVDREALALWMANSGVSWQWLGGEYRKSVALAEQSLRAALSEPQPKGTEQQT